MRRVDADWVPAKIDEFLRLREEHGRTETQEANDAVTGMLPVMDRSLLRWSQGGRTSSR